MLSRRRDTADEVCESKNNPLVANVAAVALMECVNGAHLRRGTVGVRGARRRAQLPRRRGAPAAPSLRGVGAADATPLTAEGFDRAPAGPPMPSS
jgi:hypothetical protein